MLPVIDVTASAPSSGVAFCADTPPVLRRSRAVPSLALVKGQWCRLRRRERSAAHRRGPRREAATPTRRSRQIGTVLARWRVVTVWGSRAIASRRCALIVVSVLAPPSPCRVGFHPPALPPTVPSGAADSSTSVPAIAGDSLRSTRCRHRSVTQRSSINNYFSHQHRAPHGPLFADIL